MCWPGVGLKDVEAGQRGRDVETIFHVFIKSVASEVNLSLMSAL